MWYRNGFGDCRMVGMYYCTMHHQMDLRTCAYKGQYWYNCTVTGTTLRTTHYASLSHHLAGHPTAFEIYCNRDAIHSDQTTDGQLAIYIYKRKDVGDTMDSTIRWKASIWFWPKTSSTWSEPITPFHLNHTSTSTHIKPTGSTATRHTWSTRDLHDSIFTLYPTTYQYIPRVPLGHNSIRSVSRRPFSPPSK